MQVLVIGAGVVGLAAARAAAQRGHEVIVAEAENAIGTGVSSRNSEVIHAGMYYPTGSVRAKHCVAGRRMLYEFCASHGVPHRKCGKLIVATNDDETKKVEQISAQGKINDVEGLTMLTAAQAKALEPALTCTAALLSSETGIVEAHGVMLALRGDLEDAGGALAFHAPLMRAETVSDGFVLEVGGAAPMTLQCRLLVNAAGLEAPAVARAIGGLAPEKVPTAYYAKGNYFSCSVRAPFARLIYPVPEPGGLGVHLTIDLGGQAKFGPDVEWVERIDYAVDPARAERFYPAIRRYWPGLPDGALAPSYAGIRPKIVPPAVARQDFVIQGPRDHRVAGLVNLFGIESPGLTSSLALADEVLRALEAQP